MNVVQISGVEGSDDYLVAVHVALLAKSAYPPFRFGTSPHPGQPEFAKWLDWLWEEENWEGVEMKKSKDLMLSWYEIGTAGGPKVYIGGLYQYLEYMKVNFGVKRKITDVEIQRVSELLRKQRDIFERYESFLESMKSKVKFSITGGGSNPGVASLIYSLLRLRSPALRDGLEIKLYDRFKERRSKAEEIAMKMNILESRNGHGFISVVDTFQELLDDCDVLIFLSDEERPSPDSDVEKELLARKVLYEAYGTLAKEYINIGRTRVIFAESFCSCFAASCFLSALGETLTPPRLAVLASHLTAQLKPYISKVCGFPVECILDVPVWGMVGSSHLIHLDDGRILFRYPELEKDDIPDAEWLTSDTRSAGLRLAGGLGLLRQRARRAETVEAEGRALAEELLESLLRSRLAGEVTQDQACQLGLLLSLRPEGAIHRLASTLWAGLIQAASFNGSTRQGMEEDEENKSVGDEMRETDEGLLRSLKERLAKERDQPGVRRKEEVRRLAYLTNSLKNMWKFLSLAKEGVQKRGGGDPYICQTKELGELLSAWFLDPGRKDDILYAGVISNGTHSLPPGLVLSQPATVEPSGRLIPYYNESMDSTCSPAERSALLAPLIAIARSCLKHFSIAPETETINDILEKRSRDLDFIHWRLGKLQSEFELEEICKSGRLKEASLESKKEKGIRGFFTMDEELGMEDMGEESSPHYNDINDDLSDMANPFLLGESTSVSSFKEDVKLRQTELKEGGQREMGADNAEKEPEKDHTQRRFLSELGFLTDEPGEEVPAIGPEYNSLIKRAFNEYFIKNDMLFGSPMEGTTSRKDVSQAKEVPIVVKEEMADTQEENDTTTPVAQTVSPQMGLGALIDIEQEFNQDPGITDNVVRRTEENLPEITEQHEYKKSWSMKAGYPLISQGKTTVEVYQQLLETDPEIIKEKVASAAQRVEQRYQEEMSKGTLSEETKSDRPAFERFSDSLSTFSNRTSPLVSYKNSMYLRHSEFNLEHRDEPEEVDEFPLKAMEDEANIVLRQLTPLEKMICLGAFTSQEIKEDIEKEDKEGKIIEMLSPSGLFSLYQKEVDKTCYNITLQDETLTVKQNEISERLSMTEEELKNNCSSFWEFVKESRFTNSLYDLNKGYSCP